MHNFTQHVTTSEKLKIKKLKINIQGKTTLLKWNPEALEIHYRETFAKLVHEF